MLVSHPPSDGRKGLPISVGRQRGARERPAPIDDRHDRWHGADSTGAWRRSVRHEIQTPMAIVILCGLVTSTFLNMAVVPTLYLVWRRQT